jgi:hypothetical protein
MKSRLIQETLTWANLGNISKPISPLTMNAIATILTRNGAGTVLCLKCNLLNIIRDGKFQCHCGFTANIIDCACMCGGQLLDRDRWSNSR